MGIFDIFRSKPETENQQHEPKDERKAECPNCQKTLSRIPGAKTKCPHWGRPKTLNHHLIKWWFFDIIKV